jgi:hypothetical protein
MATITAPFNTTSWDDFNSTVGQPITQTAAPASAPGGSVASRRIPGASAGVAGTYQGVNFGGGDIGGLFQGFQQAYNDARSANEQRYGQLTSGFTQRHNLVRGQIDSLGANEMEDLRKLYDGYAASATQSAISRGLYNSTVLDSLQGGVQRQRDDAVRRLQNDIDLRRANLDAQLSADTLGVIERRTDAYPDYGLMAQLAQAQGQADLARQLMAMQRDLADRVERLGARGSPSGGGGGGVSTASGGPLSPLNQMRPNPLNAYGAGGAGWGGGGGYAGEGQRQGVIPRAWLPGGIDFGQGINFVNPQGAYGWDGYGDFGDDDFFGSGSGGVDFGGYGTGGVHSGNAFDPWYGAAGLGDTVSVPGGFGGVSLGGFGGGAGGVGAGGFPGIDAMNGGGYDVWADPGFYDFVDLMGGGFDYWE